ARSDRRGRHTLLQVGDVQVGTGTHHRLPASRGDPHQGPRGDGPARLRHGGRGSRQPAGARTGNGRPRSVAGLVDRGEPPRGTRPLPSVLRGHGPGQGTTAVRLSTTRGSGTRAGAGGRGSTLIVSSTVKTRA